MIAILYATDIYESLPHTNCKNCGEECCMAFADKLASGNASLGSCAPLRLPEMADKKAEIETLFAAEN